MLLPTSCEHSFPVLLYLLIWCNCQEPPVSIDFHYSIELTILLVYPGKMSGGIQAGSRQSHPGSQVGMAGSRLRWWDPTFPTWDENLIPPGIPHLMQDSCIPPRILGGTHAFYPGSWSGFTYPTYKNIVLLFLFLQNVFVRVPILMDHPNTPQIFGMRTRQRWSLFPLRKYTFEMTSSICFI